MANELRRYTDVLSLIDILTHRRITLTSPVQWVDQNDSHGLEVYRRREKADYVTAFCMTQADETYHHWHIFAGHGHGVCVVFYKDKFIKHVSALSEIVHGPVVYRNLSSINREKSVPTDELPFLKRKMFEDEREYRLVGLGDELFGSMSKHLPISLGLIKRVVFSPYAPRPLLDTLKERLVVDKEVEAITFRHSTLTNNREWRKAIDFLPKS
ncbi:MAG: DUF2971 domain-containing protein [Pseudomonadota bacterium]|uniref:DUF2971 domain-containing protein n=1 Tax=uncultured Brevundimonas sp. TaxID=213418 RepID=UPI0025E7FC0B|nr:DUF2971 domain-containing protein [uncultured Brevundimonas sp.]